MRLQTNSEFKIKYLLDIIPQKNMILFLLNLGKNVQSLEDRIKKDFMITLMKKIISKVTLSYYALLNFLIKKEKKLFF